MTRRRWIATTATDTTATLLGDRAQHLARVLRAEPGLVADVVAHDRVYRATITTVTPDEVTFQLDQEISGDQPLPVTLALAVFKFDRMEWAIEKATELGVASIAPILARRTEKHLAQAAEKRAERWRRIAQEATKQSRRATLPTIHDPVPLGRFLAAQPPGAGGILLSETERNLPLAHALDSAAAAERKTPGSPITLAVGPEGGWAEDELALFTRHQWTSVTLGPRILRAETAAIAALAVAAALL